MFGQSRPPPPRYATPPPGFHMPPTPTSFSMPPPSEPRLLAMRLPLPSVPPPTRIPRTLVIPLPLPSPAAPLEPIPRHPMAWSTRPHISCPPPSHLPTHPSPPLPRTQRPVSCAPTPQHPVSVDDTIEANVNAWLVKNEARLNALREQRIASRPKLPEFRSKLTRWNRLLDTLRDLRSQSLPVEPDTESELITLEEECSDPAYLQRVQSKLRFIRKRRRYRKRCKLRAQESLDSDSVTVLPSSVSEILCHLRSSQERVPQESSDHTEYETTAIQKDECLYSLSPGSADAPSPSEQIDIKQRLQSIHCLTLRINERLSLLDSLTRLRSSRLAQARQKGGLFPEALDFAFNGKISELRTTLEKQLAHLQVEEDRLKKHTVVRMTPEGEQEQKIVHTNDVQLCCDHFPSLIAWKKRALFGSEYDYPDIPWRWKRFYHQADFDIADLLKIRFAWDAYLAPAAGRPDSGSPSQQDEASINSSPLLTSWILPPSLGAPDDPWSGYLREFLTDASTGTSN
ncbi:unnamed protein product [Dicrocoelium dendriticum]|nr:unnamed protein product [Dicrocoelium dendriticum]